MMLLGGLLMILGTFWVEIIRMLPLTTILKSMGGLLLLGYWVTYCRIKVTPWEVRVLSAGIWKHSYRCPLEEATVNGYWVLPELAVREQYHWAALSFSTEEDYDSGALYVEIEFYGDSVFNGFRPKQFPQIKDAIARMQARRLALESDTYTHQAALNSNA